MDFAHSDDARVQAQLDRLGALSVPQGRFGLGTITALMERLGDPHRRLPPVFHVAGTNGKGSVCAFLRAMLEAHGKLVHVTTSPHLVRYNERIRVAGELIGDAALAALLEEVLNTGEGLGASFFETTIAAAFLAFSRTPADACVVEVGMGGRFDATNVLEPEAVAACGIVALGIDHERFLLAPEEGVPKEPMARIAFEKAGIAKRGVPLVTLGPRYALEAREAIRAVASRALADLVELADRQEPGMPALPGAHQSDNASLATGMLRAQTRVPVSDAAIAKGLRTAHWPARLQQLGDGPLTALVPDRTVWLDGGHNRSAGEAIAAFFDAPLHLVIGMLANKDPSALLDPLGNRVLTLTIVPVPGHESHSPEAFRPDSRAASDLEVALVGIAGDEYPILIAGSLYLAGEALRLNHEVPA